MIYIVLIAAVFVIPIAVGAVAGARLSTGMCWLILPLLLAAMVGVPFGLLQLLPDGSFPLFEDIAGSFALIAVFLHGVIIGEYFVGVQLGQEKRRTEKSKLGSATSDSERSNP